MESNQEETTTEKNTDKQFNFKLKLLTKINNFFNDFKIDIAKSNRFLNTLMIKSHQSIDEARCYINNYIELTDHPEKEDIQLKMITPEMDEILEGFSKIKSDKKINNRLIIYYGPAGTGKTTKAIQDYPNAKIINCTTSTTSQELLKPFDFIDGKPTFKKSMLIEAMEEGQPIIFDEINLLDFEIIRDLQSILDNKSFFDIELNGSGYRVNIKEGFKIIGTMNLAVNGRIYPLSEPLVDRCADIVKMELPLDQLVTRCF